MAFQAPLELTNVRMPFVLRIAVTTLYLVPSNIAFNAFKQASSVL